jgi:hypothetical protein
MPFYQIEIVKSIKTTLVVQGKDEVEAERNAIKQFELNDPLDHLHEEITKTITKTIKV